MWYYTEKNMQKILYGKSPSDFYYHRKYSPEYAKYLENIGSIIVRFWEKKEIIWWKKFFWNFFILGVSERSDKEPDIAEIKKQTGARHGAIIWIPNSQWLKKPTWRKNYLRAHYTDTGFAVLENNYRKKWSKRAQRAYKKFEKSSVRIEEVSREVFRNEYERSDFLPSLRKKFAKFFYNFSAINPKSVRQWIAYNEEWKAISGLAVHDYLGNHSVHLVAFSTPESHASQAGTGLIDHWFQNSLTKWIKYINFDHICSEHDSKSQKWYSDFKNNFIDTHLHFSDSFIRFF